MSFRNSFISEYFLDSFIEKIFNMAVSKQSSVSLLEWPGDEFVPLSHCI